MWWYTHRRVMARKLTVHMCLILNSWKDSGLSVRGLHTTVGSKAADDRPTDGQRDVTVHNV